MSAIAVAIALVFLAGLLTALSRSTARGAALTNAPVIVLAAVVGAVTGWNVLARGESLALSLFWAVPAGAFAVGLDPLSAFFLLPVAVLSAVGTVYAVGYLEHVDAGRARTIWASFDALVAGMLLVLIARNAVLFIVAWELMSMAAWGLVAFGRPGAEARRAGWIYLVAAHTGSVALLLVFAILADTSAARVGFDAITGHGTLALPSAWILAFGLVGFGVKAGVIPLHVWLPEAHAAAPSHVSALMSGAMVTLGLYGLLRLAVLLGPLPEGTGLVLAALGLAGALLGIALALHQRDLKRALAYSSVENLGLMTLGLGLALFGVERGDAAVALFGLMAALLHVWNHAVMKGLLFLAAGAVLHAAGTRDLERLGGLLRRMPITGAGFALGAVAISGLPPLNGFVSEWLLYRCLIGLAFAPTAMGTVVACLAVALLALVGGLAAVCFVRLVGIGFLGEPRSPEARAVHEGGLLLWGSAAPLAVACIVLSVVPGRVVQLTAPVATQLLGPDLAGAEAVQQVAAAVTPIGVAAALGWGSVLIAAVPVWLLIRARSGPRSETWACGYAQPSARMQYTGRSFSELAATRVLPRWLAPRVSAPVVEGCFPASVTLASEEADPLTSGVYEPLFSALAGRFSRLRGLQQGNAHVYLTYILVAVLSSLAWVSWRAWGSS
jgi:formate hydrogenlyase subunit 3/multisubunit Na+/H+ antiporter MnhD subunit